MDLERIGHELVVKGAEQFNRKMREAQKAADDLIATIEKGAKSKKDLVPKGTESRLDKLKSVVRGVVSEIKTMPGPIGAASRGLSRLTDLVGLSTGKWIALTAAVTAASVVLLKLGARGAVMEGVINAFYAITESVGLASRVLLNDLRVAAAGTVRDFDLMRLTNLALAGATDTLANEIGSKLPQLLEIARTQARATGQSVDYLFNSLVTGVKRATPLLIDNTGIVLKIGDANAKMAAQLGKTVEQLTQEEKAIAILNATLEAGQRAVDLYGSKTKTASEYAAGLGVRLQNTLDRLGIALLPLYTLILQVGDAILEGLLWPIDRLLIPALYELNKAIFGPVSQAFLTFKQLVTTALGPLANWLRSWLPPIIASFRLLGLVLSWLVRTAGKALAGIVQQIHTFTSEFFKGLDPQKFFEGGARVIGSLAQGMLWAANTILLPAVIEIATLIADFLVGLSPPKRGPLSLIDKGGENVMLAWLEGFTGVGIDPVEDVVAEVNDALGAIGQLSLKQVEKALARLDAAIQPFIDRLSIVKARMEAILAPLNQIRGVIERKLDRELKGFFAGEIDEDTIRALDRQAEAVDAQISGVMDMTDEAEYQLLLMQLQQAEARALLEIQQRRLQGTEDEADALADLSEGLADALGGGGAGEGLADALGGGLGGLGGLGDIDPLADFLGIDEDAVTESMSGIQDAFMEGFGAEGLAALDEFRSKTGDLQTQLDRIKGSSGAQKIAGVFSTIIDTITEKSGEITSKITGFVDEFEEQWNRLKEILPIDSLPIDTLRDALVYLVAANIVIGVGKLALALVGLSASLLLTTVGNIASVFSWIIRAAAPAVVTGVWELAGAIIAMTTPAVILGMKAIQGAFMLIYNVANVLPGLLSAAAAPLALIFIAAIGIAERWDDFKRHVTELIDNLKKGDLRGILQDLANLVVEIPLGFSQFLLNLFGISDAEFWERLNQGVQALKDLALILWLLGERVADWLGGILDKVGELLVYPFEWAVDQIEDVLFGHSLQSLVEAIPIQIYNWLEDLGTSLYESLVQPFIDKVLEVWGWLKDTTKEGSLAQMIFNLPGNIVSWLSEQGGNLLGNLKTALLQPFIDMVTDIWNWLTNADQEGSLAHTLVNLPGKLAGWLGDLATTLGAAVTGPIITAMNSMIAVIESAINAVIDQINNLLGYDLVEKGLGLLGLGGQKLDPVSIPRIPGAREGAWPGSGWMQLHRDELVYAPREIGVFPQQLSRAMMRLMGGPQAQDRYLPASGGSTTHTTSTDNRRTTNTFNVRGSQSMRLALAQAKAWT